VAARWRFAAKVASWAPATEFDRRTPISARVGVSVDRRADWLQVRFGLVGSSGYAVNPAVFGAYSAEPARLRRLQEVPAQGDRRSDRL
jgi:hypothetical protein